MVDVNKIILKAKEDLAKDLTLEEIVQLKNNYLSKKGKLWKTFYKNIINIMFISTWRGCRIGDTLANFINSILKTTSSG